MNFIKSLICSDCKSSIHIDDGLICDGCGRSFKEEGGILNLLPTAKNRYATIEERDISVFDDIERTYEQAEKFSGARKIIGDWSLTKIENVNLEIMHPYMDGKNVLEIGCGRGYLTALISRKASVATFDISKVCLGYAREQGNLADAFYFQGNVLSIPFESNTFNIVVATEVLEHLPGVNEAMDEVNRVTKDGGYVIASVPNTMMFFYPLVLLYLSLSPKGWRYLIGRVRRRIDDSPKQYHRPFLPNQFRRLFEGHGFKVIDHRTSMCYFYRPPYDKLIMWGDRYCPSITKKIVSLVIRITDLALEKKLPVIKWFGARQHILVRKERN